MPWRSMRTILAGFWRGRDVGIVYGVIVIIASTWIGLHSDLTVRRLVEDVSTNLDNMRSHPVAVLAASAFMVSPLTQLLLVPVVVVVFGIVQRWLGRTALIAIWAFGHVGATLFVMAMEINALYRDLAHFSIVAKLTSGQLRHGGRHRTALRSPHPPLATPVRSGLSRRDRRHAGHLADLHLPRTPDRDRDRSRDGGSGARRRAGVGVPLVGGTVGGGS